MLTNVFCDRVWCEGVQIQALLKRKSAKEEVLENLEIRDAGQIMIRSRTPR